MALWDHLHSSEPIAPFSDLWHPLDFHQKPEAPDQPDAFGNQFTRLKFLYSYIYIYIYISVPFIQICFMDSRIQWALITIELLLVICFNYDFMANECRHSVFIYLSPMTPEGFPSKCSDILNDSVWFPSWRLTSCWLSGLAQFGLQMERRIFFSAHAVLPGHCSSAGHICLKVAMPNQQ